MTFRRGCESILVLALAYFVVNAGCTLILNHDKQCTIDDDCKRFSASAVCVDSICRSGTANEHLFDAAGVDAAGAEDGGASGPDWSCLGNVVWPSGSQPQVQVAMPFFDLVNKVPVTAGILVRPCAKMDILCANPLGPAVAPDGSGTVSITVPTGFDGYAEVVSTTTLDDAGTPTFVPALVFFNPPPIEDTRHDLTMMFSPIALAVLAASQGNTIDPTLGSLFSGAIDCKGKLSAGVSWEPDRTADATRRFYYVGGLPSEAAVATDSTGYGGLINLPTGTIILHAKLQETGQAIGSVSVFIRKGCITQVDLGPSP